MFELRTLAPFIPRTIDFSIYGSGVNLGHSVTVGVDDTFLFYDFDAPLITANMAGLSAGISLAHSHFEFGLALPAPNIAGFIAVSSLAPGSELRYCNSKDPSDLAPNHPYPILTVPSDYAPYTISNIPIDNRDARYLLFSEGLVETCIHSVSVFGVPV